MYLCIVYMCMSFCNEKATRMWATEREIEFSLPSHFSGKQHIFFSRIKITTQLQCYNCQLVFLYKTFFVASFLFMHCNIILLCFSNVEWFQWNIYYVYSISVYLPIFFLLRRISINSNSNKIRANQTLLRFLSISINDFSCNSHSIAAFIFPAIKPIFHWLNWV